MTTLLRYPGGKSRNPINNIIVAQVLNRFEGEVFGGVFGELFFGGGGITISLLKRGALTRLVICEKDPGLFKLWKAVICRPAPLLRQIAKFRPSVGAFLNAKSLLLAGSGTGFDALVANRLSHGGRGVMAGPQGGNKQTGAYKIGCRWRADQLDATVRSLHTLFKTVEVEILPGTYLDCPQCDLLYLDPPYWAVGEELYQHSFGRLDHALLRTYLEHQAGWVLSYNNCAEIRKLYKGFEMVTAKTSGNGGLKDNELLILK
jgi:DNA adenine methylase